MAAKPWLIHVKTIDGEETTLQQQGDIYHIPVAELVEAACNEIGIPTALSSCMLWIERLVFMTASLIVKHINL